MAMELRSLLALFAIGHLYQSVMVVATTFTIVNKCGYTVWPGILSNAGISDLSTTGFELKNGETQTINPPSAWGGRLWGRTLCSTDSAGKFTCKTGDCGSGKLECAGGAKPPATLAEFTLDGSGGQDFYDVSLVDGYNVPMLVVPRGGSGQNCSATGCAVDLNGACPTELQVTNDGAGAAVACRSACEAFNEPRYCCSGSYGTPDTCQPSSYSLAFKKACPTAYSYAYDDPTSTFICGGSADYTITFCPLPNTSQKASSTEAQAPPTEASSTEPIMDSSMVYEGALDASTASSPPYTWTAQIKSQRKTAIGFLTSWWWLWALMICHHRLI